MKARLLLAAMVLFAIGAQAANPKNRSDSNSKQFSVYCDDAPVRHRVAGFVEEVKNDVLGLLGETDKWKVPIIVTINPETAGKPAAQPVAVRAVRSDFGLRIEVDVHIGDDPGKVNLQKHIIRAVLLEYMYRTPDLAPGEHYVEAPWWVIEGSMQMFRRREQGIDTALFKKLMDSGKVPALDEFLTEKPADIGAAAMSIDHACAMALVQLLIEQPGGRESLARLIREWPKGNGDPAAALAAAYPALVNGTTLQKWWTLSLARFAAADRSEGKSAADTDRELTTLTEFEMVTDKSGTVRKFTLNQYREFVKLPSARAILAGRQTALVQLSVQANYLFRPVISEYEQIVGLLARGKTSGMKERIERALLQRESAVRRISDIEDYMNWFEATKMSGRSDAFDSYLRAANEIEQQDRRAADPISRYLDQMEKELNAE